MPFDELRVKYHITSDFCIAVKEKVQPDYKSCIANSLIVYTTEALTEWQRPLGVHSIMMGKFAQAGEGGGCRPMHLLSLYLPSRTKLQCTLQLRGQIHSPNFISTVYLYVFCGVQYSPISYLQYNSMYSVVYTSLQWFCLYAYCINSLHIAFAIFFAFFKKPKQAREKVHLC
jgi:hypothetical protein